ncbi:MAG: class I SAM-dependent DNA methyltransferase, partial [Lysobacterales bacterium]
MPGPSLRTLFLDLLTRLGGSAGNGRLREALEWREATFEEVKALLIAEGVIKPGRGRGGSVRLAESEARLGDPMVDAGATLDPPLLTRQPVGAKSGARSPKASGRSAKRTRQSSATIGFEAKLWLAADKLRNNMDAAEYKHVVLGLIFLKYISDSFEAHRAKLVEGVGDYAGADPEDPDEYRAENVFWVPADARWAHLQASARQPTIGKTVDDAMVAIERDNPRLKGVLPKDYARPALDKQRLGELIDLIATIDLIAADQPAAEHDPSATTSETKLPSTPGRGAGGEGRSPTHRSVDLLGRVYEYFLTRFASAEGKNGGQFYTPSCVVRCLVEMLEPYKGRIYDPCCGSGGMFVQSEKFVES